MVNHQQHMLLFQHRANDMNRIKGLLLLILLAGLMFSGCGSVQQPQSSDRTPVGIYEINYDANIQQLKTKSIDVTPSQALQNQSGKADVFQIGNVVYNGATITVTIYITNISAKPWTGVEMQTYRVRGDLNTTAYGTDLGTGWGINNPVFGPWG